MSNFYAEGVDLKVAEKYRIPPRIAIARDVIARVCGDHYKQLTADPETEYNFSLERSVIQKIEEWKRVHDETEGDRQEQLRARDRERRLLIEQQQKLLLNQVSYPSTDDLSLDGEAEERAGQRDNDDSSGEPTKPHGDAAVAAAVPVTSAHRLQGDFSVILQPTIVPDSTTTSTNGDSGQRESLFTRSQQQARGSHSASNNSSSLARATDYSEWESDNYSPFDRMELKSINDLDILAQVLQTTQLNRNALLSPPPPAEAQEGEAIPSEGVPQPTPPKSPPASPVEESATRPNVVSEAVHPVQQDSLSAYSWNNGTPHTAHQAGPPSSSADTITTFPTYLQEYGQLQHGGYYNQQQHLPHQYHSNNPAYTHPNDSYQYPPQFSANYNSYSSPMHHQTNPYSSNGPAAEEKTNAASSLLRSRSKSVPDIVNELEEEVKASEQRRRVRNHSQSCKARDEDEEDEGDEEEDRPTGNSAFERLPPESKELALKISKMGFPVDVVATVIEQLGNDDKKVMEKEFTRVSVVLINPIFCSSLQIIEHLIPLSQLLEFGFEISPSSEALLKFNNNRERALDFLIS